MRTTSMAKAPSLSSQKKTAVANCITHCSALLLLLLPLLPTAPLLSTPPPWPPRRNRFPAASVVNAATDLVGADPSGKQDSTRALSLGVANTTGEPLFLPAGTYSGKGCYFLVFVPTIREIRDFYREM